MSYFTARVKLLMLLIGLTLATTTVNATEVKAAAAALFNGLEQSIGELYNTNQLTQDNLKALLRIKLIPASDTKYFAYKVLGKHLANMTAEQKLEFIEVLSQNLINSYSSVLVKYKNEKIVLGEPKIQPSGKIADVSVEIMTVNRPVKAVSKWLYNENLSTWQIFDIVIEGISLLQSKQAEINGSISRVGLAGTLEKLKQINLAK